MSKQWFYEVMGTVIGPISSAELKQRVLAGKIPSDTPIRLGTDGKWQSADRVKGLLDTPAAPSMVANSTSPKPSTTSNTIPVSVPSAAVVASTPAIAPATTPGNEADDSTYHFSGDTAELHGAAAAAAEEYDFFRFVGFEQALGVTLHRLLGEYCQTQHVTLTRATRRAVAAFFNRPDLSGDPPAKSAPPAP